MANTQLSCIQGIDSAVPGNIGIVQAQVLVWDHDPFVARAMQNLSFPFNTKVATESDPETTRKCEFIMESVSLNPIIEPTNMYVATIKKTESSDYLTLQDSIEYIDPCSTTDCPEEKPTCVNGVCYGDNDTIPPTVFDDNDVASLYSASQIDDFDFVGSIASGANSSVRNFLPNGSDYTATEFSSNLWVHVGSLFRNRPTMHPSEYNLAHTETEIYPLIISQQKSKTGFTWDMSDLQCAVKWDYYENKEKGENSFWPYMISKQTPNYKRPIHWTLQKYTKVWQGCDFVVHLKKGDKELDQGLDTFPTDEVIDTEWNGYKYLMYHATRIPSDSKWFPGISNEAYHNDAGNDDPEENTKALRKEYWWQYKSYILIEIGWNHPDHNYIIEIVKGRKIRLIHLGKEWDHPLRLTPQATGIYESTDGWAYLNKSRVIAEYEGVTADSILSAGDTYVAVRNYLGKLVITFKGYENNPWVITRRDRVRNSLNNDKEIVPCIVPHGYLRLHGGNISIKVNFNVLTYPKEGKLKYEKISCDTHAASSANLYMTFSHMGNIPKKRSRNIRKMVYGNDPLVPPGDPSYDCDASLVKEYIKNAPKEIKIYDIFKNQYVLTGKGFINGAESVISKPHSLLISNSGTSLPFAFGRKEKYLQDDEEKDYSSQWNIIIHLLSGSVSIPAQPSNPFTIENTEYANVLNPIATQWRLMLTGGEKAVEGVVDPIDITQLVMEMSDKWSAEDYTMLTHEASLKCYLPVGTPVGLPGNVEQINLSATAKKLYDLHKQAFYVTIKCWWDSGVGLKTAPNNLLSGWMPPEEDDTLIQMTGIAFGADIDKSVNKLIMNIKVKDYMDVFKKQFIYNSPFFDGVSDTLAVYELAKLAGFDDRPVEAADRTKLIDRRCLGFLQKVLDDLEGERYYYNGDTCVNRPYDLPSGFSNLASPAVRFNNGESYDAALKKIAQYAGKTVYFDRFGVLKYENNPAYEVAFASPKQVEDQYKPVYEFVTSPLNIIPQSPDDGGGVFLNNGFVFNSATDLPRLVWNTVKYGRAVEDCVNQIVIMTASKDIYGTGENGVGGFIIEGHTFFDQIWDPESEGFLGFRKTFYQSNGIFGDLKGVRNAVLHYAKMRYPPSYASFETFGIPGIKALDIITLDKEFYYITDISHSIDPKENKWWMNVQVEWFKPLRADSDKFFGEPDVSTIPGLPNV